MNKSQRKAINRIIRFYRERVAYTGCTSVRLKIIETDYGHIWVYIKTRRSDCHRNSPRAILSEETASFCLGKRGAITVWNAEDGLQNVAKHVAYMLGGKLHKTAA